MANLGGCPRIAIVVWCRGSASARSARRLCRHAQAANPSLYDGRAPWQSVVIYPDRETEDNHIGHYDVLLESSRVHRIYLEDIAEQRTDEIGINLLQLIAIEEEKAAARAFSLVERVRKKPADVQWKASAIHLSRDNLCRMW